MSEYLIDRPLESGIPWATPISWQAANQAVDYHLQRYRSDLKQPAIVAHRPTVDLYLVFVPDPDRKIAQWTSKYRRLIKAGFCSN